MTKIFLQALMLAALHIASFATIGAESSLRSPESRTVAKARELVDTYYGNQENLRNATALLERAHSADPRDARVFVEAARITVMGGHVKFDVYERGTFERYAALLDRAISLDPNNAKAHSLKSQVFEQQGRFAEQLAALDKARALDASDPWLQIGYASYFERTNSPSRAFEHYSVVERLGPGTTATQRKAYVAALRGLRGLPEPGEDVPARVRKYAALALAARYPTDAWTPHAYAEDFIFYHLFDDAIFYSREALKTMNFGAARLTLAASLYARAAQLKMGNAPEKELTPLLEEARKLGFSRSTILDFLLKRRGYDVSLAVLEPTLRIIVP